MTETANPRQMVAVVCVGGPERRVLLKKRDLPRPAAGEVVVRVDYAALNRHDLFVLDRDDASVQDLVLGSDAWGEVVELGESADRALLGRVVVVNPCLGWDDPQRPPLVPEVLGDPRPGTLAEYVVLPEANVRPAPSHLRPEEAAGLGLAAMTAYRALFTQALVGPESRVLITGAGGGVASIAVTMARAVGAWVAVTSRSQAALDHVRSLGANAGVLHDDDWREVVGEVDAVVDSVGAPAVEKGLRALRPGGRLVSFGATAGSLAQVDLRDLFFRQVTVTGSSMASEPEFDEMLAFTTRHEITPPVGAVYELADIEAALLDLREGRSFGKVVIRVRGQ